MGTTGRQEPSAELAEFVTTLTYDDIPDAGVRTVERSFVDTVGVAVAGMQTDAGNGLARVVTRWNDTGETTVIGHDVDAGLTDATFANATASHVLDFDDASPTGVKGHPSADLVAPIIALGERLGETGTAAIEAYVAGFETMCYLAAPMVIRHYELGWHATSTLGTFGVAAASAKLLDLPEHETRHALNIAASMPAGLKRNFGSMTKSVHVGQAARSGLTAALLASEGFTADAAAIGGQRGFVDIYSGGADIDRDDFPSLESRWAIVEDGLQIKKYPCCNFAHSGIQCVIDIVVEHDVRPEDIRSIDVRASNGARDALIHDDPDSGLEGKFSMPYTLAYAAVNRTVDIEAFDDENIDDPPVQALRERVTFEADPEFPYGAHLTEVVVRTESGDRYEAVREKSPGREVPLSDDELYEKFIQCMTVGDLGDVGDTVWEKLNTLRETRDIGTITREL